MASNEPLVENIEVGHRIEFDSDLVTDKGPCSCKVIAVTDKTITVSYGEGDDEEIFNKSSIKPKDTWNSPLTGDKYWLV